MAKNFDFAIAPQTDVFLGLVVYVGRLLSLPSGSCATQFPAG